MKPKRKKCRQCLHPYEKGLCSCHGEQGEQSERISSVDTITTHILMGDGPLCGADMTFDKTGSRYVINFFAIYREHANCIKCLTQAAKLKDACPSCNGTGIKSLP